MFKTCLAIGTGKAVAGLVSAFRLGAGTSLPGKLARKIDPALLKHLGQQVRQDIIAVSGTNGKTTTCGLLAQFLHEAQQQVVHNQLGANMLPGITAALMHQSNLSGELEADYAVLEVDEASLKGVASELAISRVLVTNLFRDQLDRYGELDTTARMIRAGIEAGPSKKIVLNADDPLVAALGQGASDILYFGVAQVAYQYPLPEVETAVIFPQETADCPVCKHSLVYSQTIYGHLGHYQCNDCGYQRPAPQILAERVVICPDRSTIDLSCNGLRFQVQLMLPGLFNVYNLLAAIALISDLGLPNLETVIHQGLTHYQSVFGRAEKKLIDGKSVMVMLIKNPVGATEVIKLVAGDPKGRLLIALNDNYADGRDVSWIWDAQFELLAGQLSANGKPVLITGVRAEDMALRLKYAGIPDTQLLVVNDLKDAVHKAVQATPSDETLYLLPTYTALLDLRHLI